MYIDFIGQQKLIGRRKCIKDNVGQRYKSGLRKYLHFRSVSIGVWVGIEPAFSLNNNGVSHFIEHILFKAPKKTPRI